MRDWGMRAVGVFALAAVCFWPRLSSAAVTTEQFFEFYDGPDADARNLGLALINSAFKGMGVANVAASDNGNPLYCHPKDLSFEPVQLVLILRNFTKKHPGTKSIDFEVMLFLALQDVFPCK